MKRCLVVDDSKVVRIVARKILEELEFEVVEAEDGKQALALCKARMPDSVLVDWSMPVMGGIGFLRELRRQDNGASPVVVFCSTETSLERIREAVAAGANEYIMKPFDSEILETKFQLAGLLR